MNRSYSDFFLALAGGALLAIMIQLNSLLASYSTPLLSSWTAHGVGAAGAWLLLNLLSATRKKRDPSPDTEHKAPVWAYFGGVPGAFTVVLASISVNSALGLAGTLALGLVGQMVFSLVSDHFGWFGAPRRAVATRDIAVIALVLSGSVLIIFS